MIENITERGYHCPTAIQMQAIPIMIHVSALKFIVTKSMSLFTVNTLILFVSIKGTLSHRNSKILLILFPCHIVKYHQIYN